VLDAGSETQVADLAGLYKSLGKDVFALCDNQEPAAKAAIEAVARLFMHSESGIEDLVLKNTTPAALQRFAGMLVWPPHLSGKYPDLTANTALALSEYFQWSKGNWGLADFLAQCMEAEIPAWLRQVCTELKAACEPPAAAAPGAAGT
jgi:putative ATP-dependent endonuclease of OLD family